MKNKKQTSKGRRKKKRPTHKPGNRLLTTDSSQLPEGRWVSRMGIKRNAYHDEKKNEDWMLTLRKVMWKAGPRGRWEKVVH